MGLDICRRMPYSNGMAGTGHEIANGDLLRLMSDVEKLARPAPVRSRGGQWRRDPRAEWDWYYALEPSLRSWISRNLMAPDGERGQAPDQLAELAHFDYVEDWAAALVQAAEVVRAARGRNVDPLAAEWEDYAAESATDDLVGPDEVAELLQVTRNALAQWRHRGQLPPADLVLSGMDIWHERTIVEWARRTGREIVQL